MRIELQKYLDDYGVRQIWVAEKMGVSKQMINLYLKGDRDFSKKNQVKLRELLDRVNGRMG